MTQLELLKEIEPLFIRYDKSKIEEERKQLNFGAQIVKILI